MSLSCLKAWLGMHKIFIFALFLYRFFVVSYLAAVCGVVTLGQTDSLVAHHIELI